jgi:photoactive yellow protein
MEHISFEGVNLAELLPRIPDSVKDGLPFGLVKLDLTGKILEYNMAEGDLTGVSPAWALGKNFFDEVALCTKTQAFYGRFVEGVKKGFINAVFDYTFDHREVATKVKVHMVTVPDHLGRKNVMILVKRANKPLMMDAVPLSADPMIPAGYVEDYNNQTRPAQLDSAFDRVAPVSPGQSKSAGTSAPSIQDIVTAVIALMNQAGAQQDVQGTAQAVVNSLQTRPAAPQAAAPAPAPYVAQAPAPAPAPAAAPSAPAGKSRIEDILKF